jgi:hypothetical protein
MATFREFELEVIRRAAGHVLSDLQMEAIRNLQTPGRYEYTGCGYFLTVRHPSLPAERRTLSEPAILGNVGEIQAGFVVFLGDGELVLECHTWGPVAVPEDFRDRDVVVSTSPVTS